MGKQSRDAALRGHHLGPAWSQIDDGAKRQRRPNGWAIADKKPKDVSEEDWEEGHRGVDEAADPTSAAAAAEELLMLASPLAMMGGTSAASSAVARETTEQHHDEAKSERRHYAKGCARAQQPASTEAYCSDDPPSSPDHDEEDEVEDSKAAEPRGASEPEAVDREAADREALLTARERAVAAREAAVAAAVVAMSASAPGSQFGLHMIAAAGAATKGTGTGSGASAEGGKDGARDAAPAAPPPLTVETSGSTADTISPDAAAALRSLQHRDAAAAGLFAAISFARDQDTEMEAHGARAKPSAPVPSVPGSCPLAPASAPATKSPGSSLPGAPIGAPLHGSKRGSALKRCGECAGCRRRDCERCINCKDRPSNGGPGLRKKACEMRRCLNLVPAEQSGGNANSRIPPIAKVQPGDGSAALAAFASPTTPSSSSSAPAPAAAMPHHVQGQLPGSLPPRQMPSAWPMQAPLAVQGPPPAHGPLAIPAQGVLHPAPDATAPSPHYAFGAHHHHTMPPPQQAAAPPRQRRTATGNTWLQLPAPQYPSASAAASASTAGTSPKDDKTPGKPGRPRGSAKRPGEFSWVPTAAKFQVPQSQGSNPNVASSKNGNMAWMAMRTL